MEIDRRTMLAGGLATLAVAPALAKRAASTNDWYRNALVIDGLGSVNDPYDSGHQLRLTERAWAEMRMTGITAVRDTLLPVGNHADNWEQFLANLS